MSPEDLLIQLARIAKGYGNPTAERLRNGQPTRDDLVAVLIGQAREWGYTIPPDRRGVRPQARRCPQAGQDPRPGDREARHQLLRGRARQRDQGGGRRLR